MLLFKLFAECDKYFTLMSNTIPVLEVLGGNQAKIEEFPHMVMSNSQDTYCSILYYLLL